MIVKLGDDSDCIVRACHHNYKCRHAYALKTKCSQSLTITCSIDHSFSFILALFHKFWLDAIIDVTESNVVLHGIFSPPVFKD